VIGDRRNGCRTRPLPPHGCYVPVVHKNTLYYGDNLKILRDKMPPESVDLVYLAPSRRKSLTPTGTSG
jgi:hypothetical protein